MTYRRGTVLGKLYTHYREQTDNSKMPRKSEKDQAPVLDFFQMNDDTWVCNVTVRKPDGNVDAEGKKCEETFTRGISDTTLGTHLGLFAFYYSLF